MYSSYVTTIFILFIKLSLHKNDFFMTGFFRFWYLITQSSFKVLLRNTDHETDQLNKFQPGARLEPAVHSAR
jgi:hypothetical protein